jgi:fumarate reductase subunit C
MARKPYVRPINKSSWWLSQGNYTNYFLREMTCVFIGAYTTVLIFGLWRLTGGKEAFDGFLEAMKGEGAIVFHVVAFVFALIQTTSWFNVTPKAMRIQRGEDFVPGPLIVGAHYAIWVVVSAIFLLFVGA